MAERRPQRSSSRPARLWVVPPGLMTYDEPFEGYRVLDEMRSAALLQKVWRTDGQAISAEQCFAMGTELGGRVLDLPVGRIAPGFRADLVALDLGDPSLWPRGQLAKNAVYSLSARAITDVVVDGDIVVENRRLVRVDQQEIEARVRATTSTWGGQG